MRRVLFILIISLLLMCTYANAQKKKQPLMKNLIVYIDKKKEPGAAFAWAFCLPAGGQLYAESNSFLTLFVLAGEIAATWYVIKKKHKMFWSIFFIKAASGLNAGDDVRKYNDKLKKELNLDFYVQK